MRIELDENGAPVMLADVAPSGISKIDANAKSGNPAHDTRTGKFGSTGGNSNSKAAAPNVNPVDFYRMLDAVRFFARSFSGQVTEENIRLFIEEKAKDPGSVDVGQFMQLVQQQQINDLVDIIDQKTPGNDVGVKVSASAAHVKETIAGLDDAGIAELQHRLIERGNKESVIDDYVQKRIPKERKQAAKDAKQALNASLENSDPFSVTLFESPLDEANRIAREKREAIEEFAKLNSVELAEAMKSMPAPIVNVHIDAPKPTRREVVRDEYGLVVGVREIPEDS